MREQEYDQNEGFGVLILIVVATTALMCLGFFFLVKGVILVW